MWRYLSRGSLTAGLVCSKLPGMYGRWWAQTAKAIYKVAVGLWQFTLG